MYRGFHVAGRGLAGCLFAVCTAAGQTEFTLDFARRAQTIENIGSSTGMHGDYIAKHWKPETTDAIADLLFSQKFAPDGRPLGIGLSSFRIQIGAGAAGEEGGIRAPWRRTDCFLRPDGSYDWENQGQGTFYWRKKAEQYGLNTVIGYLNSPPVYFTESGYVFKTDKTFRSNLKPGHYKDYARFLGTVARHFQSLKLPFSHISPVNEPQWDWLGVPGKAKQEGSPWTNDEIARLIRLIDPELRNGLRNTRLLIPEAAEYHALVGPMQNRTFAAATDQIDAFWNRESTNYLGNLQSLENVVAGHAYFSDSNPDMIMQSRASVVQALEKIDPSLRFWQTEYSLLGDGWTGGLPARSVDEMQAGLLLARTIHADFTLANATAWQWWSSTEPGMGRVPRYCLIECDPGGEESYRPTKLLWALGHYSRFVRPGMVRIEVQSEYSTKQSLSEVMVSAYHDIARNRWVMVLINFTDTKHSIRFKTRMLPGSARTWTRVGFLTGQGENMKRFEVTGEQLDLPPKSIVTIVSGTGR